MLGLYHKLLQGLIHRHRQDAGDAVRLSVLDARSRRGTLSPRNIREWSALMEGRELYHGSLSHHLCIALSRLNLWEVAWLFTDQSHKDVWREITSKF